MAHEPHHHQFHLLPSPSDHHEPPPAFFTFTNNNNHNNPNPDHHRLVLTSHESHHPQILDHQVHQLYLSLNPAADINYPDHQGLLLYRSDDHANADQFAATPFSNSFGGSTWSLGHVHDQLPPIHQSFEAPTNYDPQSSVSINDNEVSGNYIYNENIPMLMAPPAMPKLCDTMDGDNCKLMITAFSQHHHPPSDFPLQDSFVLPNTDSNQMDYIEAIISSLPSSSSSSSSLSSTSSLSSSVSALSQFLSNPNILIPSRWDA